MSDKQVSQDNAKWWLDNPSNIKLIITLLCVLCAALFIADFLYHKHGHFEFEHWPGFYAWYGFLSYCAIVLTAKQLRKIIGRSESFYESDDSDLNNEPNSFNLNENQHITVSAPSQHPADVTNETGNPEGTGKP